MEEGGAGREDQRRLTVQTARPTAGPQAAAPRARRRRLDWPAIEADYRSGLHSLRQMAARHGCAPSTIANKATRAGWCRDQPRPRAVTAAPAAMAVVPRPTASPIDRLHRPRRVGIIASMNTTLPCVLMRAGTSRGPFFLRDWLPAGDEARDETLIGAIGASDPLQLDGVGGGSTLNSKVAIVSRSERDDCDVDYLFAQVGVGQRSVDTRPNCGNMLSGVAPFAIEQGLVAAQEGSTTVRVFNVNTALAHRRHRSHARRASVTYEGDARIDGVAGTAAPILPELPRRLGRGHRQGVPDRTAHRHSSTASR